MNKKQQCRGIIVIDSTLLHVLASCYAEPSKNSALAEMQQSTGSYLDLLPILAHKGYRIVIPEMVSKEAASVIQTHDPHGHTPAATNLDKYFERKLQYPTKPVIQAFCTEVAYNRYEAGNIEIATPTSQNVSKPYARYLHDLHNAIKSYTGRDLATGDKIAVRKNLQAVDEAHADRTYFGDAHALDVVKAELRQQQKTNESVPVFFISDNKKAQADLKDITASDHNLVYGLANQDLLMGLQNDFSVSEQGVKTTALQEMGLSGSVKDHWEHIAATQSKRGLPAYKEWYSDDAHKAFATSMCGMADVLAQERMQKEQIDNMMTEGPSRAQRFADKYNKNARVGASTRAIGDI